MAQLFSFVSPHEKQLRPLFSDRLVDGQVFDPGLDDRAPGKVGIHASWAVRPISSVLQLFWNLADRTSCALRFSRMRKADYLTPGRAGMVVQRNGEEDAEHGSSPCDETAMFEGGTG